MTLSGTDRRRQLVTAGIGTVLTLVMGAVLFVGFRIATQMRANITALMAARSNTPAGVDCSTCTSRVSPLASTVKDSSTLPATPLARAPCGYSGGTVFTGLRLAARVAGSTFAPALDAPACCTP